MNIEDAREAVAKAERDAKNARTGILIASDLLRNEPSLENADGLRRAKESAENYALLFEMHREALRQAEAREAEEQRLEAEQELARQLDELESERARLSDVCATFANLYTLVSNQVDVVSDILAQDALRLRAARETAERAGKELGVQPLDLEVVRIAVTHRLAERFPAADTPEDVIPPAGPLAKAIGRLSRARTCAQAAQHASEVLGELAAEVGSAPTDWLQLAPRRGQPGTTAETLKPAALALLERYCSEPEVP